MSEISSIVQKVKNKMRMSPPPKRWDNSPRYVKSTSDKRLLVLDLDETLIHSSFIPPKEYDFEIEISINGILCPIFIQKRPFLDHFLSTVEEIFDIFFFTASDPQYSIPIIQFLFPKFPEEKILTRKNCKYFHGNYLKDLSIFRRPLSEIILLDNSPSSYALQPQNGISITTWTGDCKDTTLLEMTLPILRSCATSNDVRNVIRKYS